MKQTENKEIKDVIKKLGKAEMKGDVAQMGDCCNALVDFYAKAGDLDMAIAVCQRLIDTLSSMENEPTQMLANFYFKQGLLLGDKYYRAFPCLKKALDLYKKVEDEEGLAASNYRIGRITLDKSCVGEDNAEDALPYFQDASDLYVKLQDVEQVALSLTYKGVCEINLDKLKEAEEDLENAVEIARKIDEPEILDDALYNLARAYYCGEKFFKGQKLLEQAIEINRQSKDYYDLSYMLHTYGQILFSLEKYDQAIDAFKESENIKRCSGDLRNLPDTIFWIGKTYFSMDKLPEALLYFQEEISLRNEAETESLATAYGNLAFVCQKLGYTQDAINQFVNRLKILGDEPSYAVERAETCCRLAEAHVDSGEVEIAVKIYQRAIEEYKFAIKSKQADDPEPIDQVKARVKELEEGITKKDVELPRIDVPEVLTDDYIADTLRTMVMDILADHDDKPKSIGFRQKDTKRKFSDDATFESLGADDLDLVEIPITAEKLFDIEIPFEKTEEITTTAELIAAVKELLAEQA